MVDIRRVDMLFLEDLVELGRGKGYVLTFSNRTFSQFFAEELSVDIDDPIYSRNGTSKAKRLWCFLQKGDLQTVVQTLHALWAEREPQRQRLGRSDTLPDAHGRLLELINRLSSKHRHL
jgi:hypothetical protein